MKKVLFPMLLFFLGLSAMAQQSISLRSSDKAECVKTDMKGLKASFAFSSITARDYESKQGTFSWISMPNTVIGGNEGDPQIPVVNELIAVPFGATPHIEVTSYNATDYRLADYDIKTMVPRQPSLRKDQKAEDVPFIFNKVSYQTRGMRSEPKAVVEVMGTMRGIQIGALQLNNVRYNASANTLRVYNNIEVEVSFKNADLALTEQTLVNTYSPYFRTAYSALFNNRAINLNRLKHSNWS